MGLFADARVHTNAAGAEVLAEIVVAESKRLEKDSLGAYLRAKPQAAW